MTEDTNTLEKLENNAMALEVLKLRMRKQTDEILNSLDKLSLIITGSE
jgi:hypothetical protein